MRCKMNYDDKAQPHIERMRDIVGKVGTISDDQYKMALSRSLPKPYESLVVTSENVFDTLSIEDIHARILREESRKAKCNDGEDTNESEKLLSTPDSKCPHCGKKGHIKSHCWKLYPRKRNKDQPPNFRSNRGNYGKKNDHAFTASTKGNNGSVLWYIGSGASYLSTSDESLFVEGSTRDAKKRSIELADGRTVEAKRAGIVQGTFSTARGEKLWRLHIREEE